MTRRNRELKRRLTLLKWYFIGLSLLASLAWLFLLFVPQPDPPTRRVADVSSPSPWAEELAGELRTSPVYVDPLLKGTDAARLVSPEVRSAVAASRTPVWLLAVPISWSSPGESASRVLLAEVIEAHGEDGYYVLVGADGAVSTDFRASDGRLVHVPPPHDATAATLAATIADVDTEYAAATPPDDATVVEQLMAGLGTGAVLSVPLWFIGRLVRRSARRTDGHLEGFRA